ncbi:MAG: hypothetical protein ACRDFZ_02585 [Candidatus Limnocylindria bacterium]
MTRSELDRTRSVRAWLADGSTELSPRVFENVLREIPAMSQDRPHWAAHRLGMSTMVVGAVAVVTLVVVLMSAGLFGDVTPGGPVATPVASPEAPSPTQPPIDYAYRDVGFIGLPPLGVTPSDPTTTELVENFFYPGPAPYKGQSFLYADGRLVWNEYFDSQQRSTGWLQQTLTEDGIELVRALATGTAGETLRRLDPAELPKRLPVHAWVEQAVRPYVPSGFAACLFVTEQVNPFTESSMTLPEKLAALPLAAADILRDRPFAHSRAYGPDPECLGMSVADARRLDAALRTAGLEQDAWRNQFLLEYHLVLDRPEAGIWWLSVWFEPILPDGTITCSSCG